MARRQSASRRINIRNERGRAHRTLETGQLVPPTKRHSPLFCLLISESTILFQGKGALFIKMYTRVTLLVSGADNKSPIYVRVPVDACNNERARRVIDPFYTPDDASFLR